MTPSLNHQHLNQTMKDENDWRGREYVPAEDRGMKEE